MMASKSGGSYAFSHDEISSITDTYTNWRDARGISSVDLPPNCKVVSAEEVRENEYNLTPNTYIGV